RPSPAIKRSKAGCFQQAFQDKQFAHKAKLLFDAQYINCAEQGFPAFDAGENRRSRRFLVKLNGICDFRDESVKLLKQLPIPCRKGEERGSVYYAVTNIDDLKTANWQLAIGVTGHQHRQRRTADHQLKLRVTSNRHSAWDT